MNRKRNDLWYILYRANHFARSVVGIPPNIDVRFEKHFGKTGINRITILL